MKVITISREYGAGGLSIGRAVAKQLGVEIFNRDIIKNAAKENDLDFNQIAEEEEKLSRADTIIRAINPVSFDIKDSIYEYERKAIIEFAEQGPCVIIGRCGDAILDKAGIDHLSVFLYADMDARIERVKALIGSDDPEDAKRAIHKMDIQRHAYYAYYADRKWGIAQEYDLCLNSGNLGYDVCADLICRAVR